ncbi:MAG TPA: LysR family transcriptional regulator [Ideonella sp.]|uniref:LysR substrate-binding domain-containing protein n=1 Tax=Ideonella sp. TaxID=1929293 RepID=UPI002E340213|nr:LysR family transcriptional regulator [Ideonella sp.]HEX5684316.1 LysR family transcriptional regulator [Ideonella sp.]
MSLLDQLNAFVQVAELGSFTQAADRLGWPKGKVSTTIQALENHLGTRLLHRTTRKVQLTQDGLAFHERCRDLLADVDELQALFQRSAPELRGRVRIDMSTGAARHMVIPRLPELLQRHPKLEVEISSTDRRVDVVREGFDCVLRAGAVLDSGLIARPLGRFRMVNCASPGYLARWGTPQSPDELAKHQLVHYVPVLGARPDGFDIAQPDGSARTVSMGGSVTVNNAEAYQAACLAGLGLIQAPEHGVLGLIADGALVEVLPAHRAPSMPVHLLYANRRHLPQRVRAVMDWLAEVMAPHLEPWA